MYITCFWIYAYTCFFIRTPTTCPPTTWDWLMTILLQQMWVSSLCQLKNYIVCIVGSLTSHNTVLSKIKQIRLSSMQKGSASCLCVVSTPIQGRQFASSCMGTWWVRENDRMPPKKGVEAESKSKPVGPDRCQPASANCWHPNKKKMLLTSLKSNILPRLV